MIILNKKILLVVLLSILIIFCTIIIFSNCKNTISTSSIPTSGHIVIIDAGHGYPDGGATGLDGSIESDLNLNIVLKLQKFLEASNCITILTRSNENGIYNENSKTIREKKISDMENRVNISNTSQAEIFVSIHMNKLSQAQYSGWQAFYKNDDNLSKNLANSIQYNMNYFLAENNSRKVKSISNIYLTEHIQIPLVIVECGFLSNEKENKLLQTNSYQDKLAWCIYSGIMDYFKEL